MTDKNQKNISDTVLKYQIRCLQGVKRTTSTAQKKSLLLSTSEIVKYISSRTVNQAYKPQRYSCFVVTHPKPREIFSPHYVDRIAHHLLIDRIEGDVDKRLIFDSYANRKGKGTHKAVERLRGFILKPRTKYYLQADVKSFFTSIDKKILFEIFQKHLKLHSELDSEEKNHLLELGRNIIFQDVTIPTPYFTGNHHLLKFIPPEKSLFGRNGDAGLPIGSLTSQFFASIYLNELDQFVKHELKVPFYVRYVDDFVILSDCPQQLNQWLSQINNFLVEKLRLQIHPRKTIIQRTEHGINFLGYIVKPSHLEVRRRSIKAFKRRLYFFNYLLDPMRFPICDPPNEGKLAKAFRKGHLRAPVQLTPGLLLQMLATVNSYYGVFSKASTGRLRRQLYEKHFHLLKNYLEPKDSSFLVMKFREDLEPGFYERQFGFFEDRHPWE